MTFVSLFLVIFWRSTFWFLLWKITAWTAKSFVLQTIYDKSTKSTFFFGELFLFPSFIRTLQVSSTVYVFSIISVTLPMRLACHHLCPFPSVSLLSASYKIKWPALYIANALSWRRSWKMSPTILRVWRPRLRRYGVCVCVFCTISGFSVHLSLTLWNTGLWFNLCILPSGQSNTSSLIAKAASWPVVWA